METEDVLEVSQSGTYEVIDAHELARRWRVPVTWIKSRSRSCTAKEQRIPRVKLGQYTRFEWGSPQLSEWFARQRTQ